MPPKTAEKTEVKPVPAINKLIEALPKPAAPAPIDWENGDIDCDAIQLEKPYGYQQDDAIAVGSNISNRHGVTGKVERIVWVAARGYYRVHLRCAANPGKGLQFGDLRYIIIPSGIATTS